MEGTAVSDILLDTGCTRTMVKGDLVPENNLFTGNVGVPTSISPAGDRHSAAGAATAVQPTRSPHERLGAGPRVHSSPVEAAS